MRRDLLDSAIDALEDYRDPLGEHFLCVNDVTLDEAYGLSDLLALGLRLMRYAEDHPAEVAMAVNGATQSLSLRLITERLKAMNDAAGAV